MEAGKVIDPIDLITDDPSEKYVIRKKMMIKLSIIKKVREFGTSKEAAESIGYTPQKLSGVINGMPSLDLLMATAFKLGVAE